MFTYPYFILSRTDLKYCPWHFQANQKRGNFQARAFQLKKEAMLKGWGTMSPPAQVRDINGILAAWINPDCKKSRKEKFLWKVRTSYRRSFRFQGFPLSGALDLFSFILKSKGSTLSPYVNICTTQSGHNFKSMCSRKKFFLIRICLLDISRSFSRFYKSFCRSVVVAFWWGCLLDIPDGNKSPIVCERTSKY